LQHALALAGFLALAGCTYTVKDPVTGEVMAKCHDGGLSFCQVAQPQGTTVISGSGLFSGNIVTGGLAVGGAIGGLLAQ